MAKIEVGRFSELLRRLLSMSGTVEVAQELSPEISAIFALESERPDWEFIKNAKLCTSQIALSAVPGENATGRLRNPAGSGVLAIVSGCNFSLSVLGDVLIYRVETTSNLANIVATVTRDTRWPSLNVSALIASQANVATTGDWIYQGFEQVRSPTFVRPPIAFPFILTPGFALDLTCQTDDVGMRGNFHWLERRMGELEVAT